MGKSERLRRLGLPGFLDQMQDLERDVLARLRHYERKPFLSDAEQSECDYLRFQYEMLHEESRRYRISHSA
jgi:hypothetical protein